MHRENIVKALRKTLVESMAFSRDVWIKKASQRMEGALGEYAKLKFANMIGYPDYWSHEVKRLMSKVIELFDPKAVNTKQNFDRIKAFDAAISDSLGSQEQITAARNEFIQYLPKAKDKEKFLKASSEHGLDSKEILIEMLTEYLPTDLLKKLQALKR